ncbi:MAG: hypothetical protein WAJ87_09160, partial [Bryobacteraceae bacterium]
MHDVEHSGCGIRSFEWMVPAEQFIVNGAECPDVAPRVDFLAGELLRRHIKHAANQEPSLGEARRAVAREAGDSEIHHLNRSIVEHHDVGGLDVAMDDPVLMGALQALGGLRHDAHPFQQRQRTGRAYDVLKIVAFQVFHHDIEGTVVLAELMNGDDVLVVEIPGGCSLFAETRQAAGVAFRRKDLDGYLAAHGGVESKQNLAEPAPSEFAADLVFADSLGCHTRT